MTDKVKNKVYSVTEITHAIKLHLENAFKSIYIQGEVSNFKQQSSGHMYFSLKDADAQISCALFRGLAQKIEKKPKDGDQIIIFGEISVYPPRGSYQIIVRDLRFVGLGELLLKLHELKKELAQQGYFDVQHKKKLPLIPKKIGVVTSPTGAVIQDILYVLQNRFANFSLLLNPVKVQGEGSAEEIAQAIDDLNKYQLVDVIIVGRGGGSLEDLWSFNEKIVADAIFRSKIPIISAVGHETDFSISDFVADVRAPTPSAAAQMVIEEKASLQKQLTSSSVHLTKIMLHLLEVYKNQIEALKKHPVFSFAYHITAPYFQKIDDKRLQLDNLILHKLEKEKLQLVAFGKNIQSLNPLFQLKKAKDKLQRLTYQLDLAEIAFIKTTKENLKKLEAHIRSIDPKNLLKRGYSILFSEKDHSIILSCQQAKEKQKIYALVSDGKIHATIDKTQKEKLYE